MKNFINKHLLLSIIVFNILGWVVLFPLAMSFLDHSCGILAGGELACPPDYTHLFIIVTIIIITINIIVLKKSLKSDSKIKKSIHIIIFILMMLSIINIFYAKLINPFGSIKKPILYLYPETEQNITVNFEKENLLQTTYPKFNKEWKVLAKPNGTLIDSNNNEYYALYWDEKNINKCKFEDGFYVEKEDAITFLEEKLSYIGLNPKERNEFIMYWLPILEQNKKSIVQFDLTDEIENTNKMIINPQPDSILRVHINIKKVKQKVNIKEQKLTKFNRTGFTAVEWGGTNY